MLRMLSRRLSSGNKHETPGSNDMKAASRDFSERPRDLSGPAAAVLVALAGAALVAVGLLLVGSRDDARVGLWVPPVSAVALGAAS